MSFTFGQPSSSGASSGSLFGTSGTSGNSGNTGGNLFGGGGGGGTGFSFGSGQNAASAGGEAKSLFGTTPNKTGGGLFGQQPSSGAGAASGQGFQKKDEQGTNSGTSSIFGTPKPASPAFGAPAATPATTQTQPAWGFNNPSTTPAGPPPQPSTFGASTGGAGNIFGGNKTGQDNASKTTAFSFGKPAENSAPPSGPPSQSSTPNLFGGQANSQKNTTAASNLFGQAPKPADKPAESPSTASAAPSGQKSMFSFPQPTGSGPDTTPASTAPSLFAAPSSKPAASPSLFGAAPAPTQTSTSQSTAAPSLFSQPSTTSSAGSAPKPAFSLQPPSTQAQSSTPAASSEPSKPLFGGLGGSPSSSAPTKTLFGAAPAPSTAPTPATTQSATTAPTTSSAPGGFSFGPSAANSSQAPASTAGLAASTSGPLPQAQSRLKNKTMDEILTRWATDLTKYTKEFKSHAETVAKWDQVIVDNSSKIDKLYVKTRTCEKQTMSVEMQLSAVENQQTELESWLTKYESDVDAMLSKENANPSELGGPDQERERTYKMAEKLDERLGDMGKDLSSMVDEVNAANASLSKNGKADEPITQIVRILNSHLSQLQAIDQGTAALQTRVTEAQKSASGLGYLNGGANGDGRAADDFYRSYMGRR